MLLENLRKEICAISRTSRQHSITSAPASISGIDRELGLMAITPSSSPQGDLPPSHITIMDLEGQVIEGARPPSPDAATHLALYNVFTQIGGISHTHSPCATMFAQAGRPIPCLGTTHADRFRGEIPVTRPLRKPEIEGNYAHSTGMVILERFSRLNAAEIPSVLVIQHGPFAWGASATAAVTNSIALEEIAQLALGTLQLNPTPPSVPSILLDRHFLDAHPTHRP